METNVSFGMIFTQVSGLFLVLMLGYWMNRSRKLPKEAEGIMAQLTTKLFLPALQISVFAEQCTVENLKQYSRWMFWGALFYLVSMLIAVLASRSMAKGKEYMECIYRYAFGFPNNGGFGIPLVLALFGREIFFQYQLFALPGSILCYGWGVPQLMPKAHQGGWRRRLGNLCNPVFESIFIGMVLGLTGIGRILPELVHTTLNNLGNCYSVVSLLLVGFVLGDYRIKEIIGGRTVYIFTALRLIIIPGVFLIVLKLLGVPQIIYIFTVLTFACPCGMNVVIYPASFNEDTRPGAGMILVSSTLAVITIPLLYALACI